MITITFSKVSNSKLPQYKINNWNIGLEKLPCSWSYDLALCCEGAQHFVKNGNQRAYFSLSLSPGAISQDLRVLKNRKQQVLNYRC